MGPASILSHQLGPITKETHCIKVSISCLNIYKQNIYQICTGRCTQAVFYYLRVVLDTIKFYSCIFYTPELKDTENILQNMRLKHNADAQMHNNVKWYSCHFKKCSLHVFTLMGAEMLHPNIGLKMCWQFPNDIAYCQLQQMGKIDVLVQERCNSIADALELHLSCTKPSI